MPRLARSKRSISVTAMPRRARAAATLAPAMPAPITATWRGGWTAGGVNQGVAWRRASGGGEAISPTSISRLRPNPGALRQAKPAAARPAAAPAQVKVAKVAPGRERAAMASNSACCHISGFFAGAKPSRNQASTWPSSRARRSAASPRCRSRVTRGESHRRCTPVTGSGHCASSASARSARSGQAASARARSSRWSGYFSVETRCSLACAGACVSKQAQAHSMLSPVPKPVSPITKGRPAGHAARRCGRPLP